MKEAHERIQFAVNFSQMDFRNLRPSDWLRLREEINVFMGWVYNANPNKDISNDLKKDEISEERLSYPIWSKDADIVISCHDLPLPETFPIERLEKIKEGLYEQMFPFAEANSFDTFKTEKGFPIIGRRIAADFIVMPLYRISTRKSTRGKSVIVAITHLEEGFSLVMLLLLNDFASLLRLCKDCRKIFVAHDKRKVYCSKLCVNRRVVRAWRKQQRNKLSEKNHRNYERRVHKKTSSGAKLKIERRPRKKRNL